MSDTSDYRIHLDVKFDGLELVDVPRLVAECRERWYNQTLCRVNDSVVRLGVLHGEFHWHAHADEDEFFLVLDGTLLIDLESRTVALDRHQGFLVPKGVRHRTRAPERVVVLMTESSSIVPTGDPPA